MPAPLDPLRPMRQLLVDKYMTYRSVMTVENHPGDVAQMVYAELEDLNSLFHMIEDRLREIAAFRKEAEVLRQSPADALTEEEKLHRQSRIFVAVNRPYHLAAQTAVLMKAVYEWLYHVYGLIRPFRQSALATLPESIWSELKAHCEFRDMLVAHRRQQQAWLWTMPRFIPDTMDFDFAISNATFPPGAIDLIDGLYEELASRIDPAESPTDTTTSGKLRQLYLHLYELPRPRIQTVQEIIRQNGALSAEASKLAAHVSDLAQAIL